MKTSSIPAGVDHDATIEALVHEFGDMAPSYVGKRAQELERYMQKGPLELIETLGYDPPRIALILAPRVELDIRYIADAEFYLRMDSRTLEFQVRTGAVLRWRKPLVAKGDEERLSMLLLGLLQYPGGVRLYCQVALILARASLDHELRPFLE
ncbi:MAG: hypothetical protein ABH826_01075 [Patescibacteria group bacterium]|nr:hypothetical protein [Patescibacteria group bacterium]